MTFNERATSRRIMIVDDHPVMLEGTARLFAQHADLIVIATATTGKDAIQRVAETNPDLLILDIRLPDMSGIDVIRAVRANAPFMQILVLTGYNDPAYRRALAKLGIQGFLEKTTSGDEIVAMTKRICAGKGDSIFPISPTEQTVLALTEREQVVLALLVAGYRNREIAEQLQVSLKTVEFHVGQLLAKLGVRSRAEAIAQAIALGLVTL